jgi:ketosteroid isomerase-like protein
MCVLAAMTSTAFGPTATAAAQPAPAPGRVVEVRAYTLKPGTRERFHERFVRESLPMLARWKVDVLGYGPSLHDTDSWFLVRAFPSVPERQQSEDAFYGSQEWLTGPRAAVLADIDTYATVVVRLDAATIDRLRAGLPSSAGSKEPSMTVAPPAADDLATLASLNQDYITSVQTSDVARFREILAEDFLASLPDGSLQTKAQFLEQTAKPVTISGLKALEVNVRLLGDVAIVHARTAYTTADGRPGSGRYTDVWARRGGRWLAVSAHVTRN